MCVCYLNEYFLGIRVGVGVPEKETRVKLFADHRRRRRRRLVVSVVFTRLLWVGAIGG